VHAVRARQTSAMPAAAGRHLFSMKQKMSRSGRTVAADS
jgi:hypothetical protein